jgi:hypothetical protein
MFLSVCGKCGSVREGRMSKQTTSQKFILIESYKRCLKVPSPFLVPTKEFFYLSKIYSVLSADWFLWQSKAVGYVLEKRTTALQADQPSKPKMSIACKG